MSHPQPSATPDAPAGYDTSTNLHGFISPHTGVIANGYQVAGDEEDQYNGHRAMAQLANGTVVHGTAHQTTTGFRNALTMPTAQATVK